MAGRRLTRSSYIESAAVTVDPHDASPPLPRALDPTMWVNRATRLGVGAPVAYRSVFAEGWAAGSTIDISRTGVLFSADAAPAVSAELQLVIYLSRAPLDSSGSPLPMPDLYCGGRVARVAEATGGRRAVAVQIDFEWAEAPPGRLWETGLDD
jgi:PilZ domain